MENGRFKIKYNPYEKTIEYFWFNLECDEWESPNESSVLSKSEFKSGTIQNFIDKVITIILEDYCTAGQNYDLLFEGTEDDWEDIKDIVSLIDEQHQLSCAEKPEVMLQPAIDVMPQIKAIFNELSNDIPLSLLQGDNKRMMQIKKLLDDYSDAVSQEIPLCVIGTYSAGKSALINALIGEEILPSDDNPKTGKIFKIISQPKGSIKDTTIHFEYSGVAVDLYFTQDGYCFKNPNLLPDNKLKLALDQVQPDGVSAAYIYQIIDKINDFKTGAECMALDMNVIEIRVPFLNSTLPLDQFSFVLFDTPGSESATYKQHMELLKDILEKQTNGLPIFVATPTTLDAKGAEELEKALATLGTALDGSNRMVVVNKADAGATSGYTEEKLKNTVVGRKAQNRIFLVSAIIGLGAKKSDMSACVFENTREIFEDTQRRFFTTQPLDTEKPSIKQFFQYDILTPKRCKFVREQGKQISQDAAHKQEQLLHNSGLWAVENEIGWFAQKYALYNKCYQAKDYLAQATDQLDAMISEETEKQNSLLKDINSQLDEKKQKLIKKLEEESKAIGPSLNDTYKQKMGKLYNKYENPDTSAVLKDCDAIWKNRKKNGGNDRAISNIKRKADGFVRDHLAPWKTEFTNESVTFWREQSDRYKEMCIKIVKESDAFSDTEKSILSKYILTPDVPLTIAPNFDIEKVMQKSFFFWKLKGYNSKLCKENILEDVKANITWGTQTAERSVIEQFNLWLSNFQKDLIHRMAEINPKLKELTDDFRTCNDRQKQLRLWQSILTGKKTEIDTLFQF